MKGNRQVDEKSDPVAGDDDDGEGEDDAETFRCRTAEVEAIVSRVSGVVNCADTRKSL